MACSHPFFIRAGHSAIHHIFNARLCNNWKWINPSVPSSFLALSNSKLYITYCTYYFIAHNVVTSVPIPLLPYVFCFAVPSSTHTCWYLLVRGYLHDFINYLSCKTCTHHIAMYIHLDERYFHPSLFQVHSSIGRLLTQCCTHLINCP